MRLSAAPGRRPERKGEWRNVGKERLVRCKVNLKNVHIFDKDKRTTATSATPSKFAELICNVLVKLIGRWQKPDGGAAGLNLRAIDLQVLRAYEPECVGKKCEF